MLAVDTYAPTADSLYWASVNPADQLGVNPAPGLSAEHEHLSFPGLARSTGPGANNPGPPWSPQNPLFWFGGLLALTLGFVAASTSVRIGPARASLDLGKK